MATSSASIAPNALHTVAVFADLAAATLGVTSLVSGHAFPASVVSIVAKDDPATVAWMTGVIGRPPERVDTADAGPLRCAGPMASGGWADALRPEGVEGLMRGVGFQAHDGRIFARLVERGGVLVAVTSDARAADALSVMHAYGGGNAAIGAWRGRA